MTHEKPDYDRCPALRTIAMPADANANGDVFGGWVLSQMDLAGSIIATQTSQTRVATVGIEAMSFKKPIYIGDEVSCYCRLDRVGNTSMTVHIESWARNRLDLTAHKVTEGKFTYVAIDDKGKPVSVKKSQEKS